MQSRRDFLKTTAILGSAVGLEALTDSIAQAAAIAPEPGSTFLDAEHVVILMQENRSFDHCYGTLSGVRGFNDPRAITLPGGNPVWVQTNAAGESYAPFRLNIRESNSTWMGCLPHDRDSQVDARNNGQHDRWLDAKRHGGKKYGDLPLTLGYYTRDDIPFHYALADAFTVCDQYFCSSITPTSPNRLHLWTGTVREKPSADSPACVRNEQAEREHPPTWITFPERLEANGVSWKIYQNEVTQKSGLSEEEDAWLSNFGDNPMEYFSQYHVRFAKGHRDFLQRQVESLTAETDALKLKMKAGKSAGGDLVDQQDRLNKLMVQLSRAIAERDRNSEANFQKLSARERSLHEKAFCTNAADPAYRELVDLAYADGDEHRHMKVPKGDVLHQFRQDVKDGSLPTVSWLVAPSKLSDHPDAAWFGAWYLSETLSILTQNPEVWKKTIFILTYDENDGYFDHIPPFVAPHPRRPETGAVSKGIDAGVEYVELEQELKLNVHGPRECPVGLGYRVPMVVASPWSRGGCVCSQVFDHTSILQLLEKVLTHKTGKPIVESNISQWRRTVSGDLTSVFQSAPREKDADPAFLPREAFFEQIDRAKFKPVPSGFTQLTADAIGQIRRGEREKLLPHQERGMRRSCALPYELLVDGGLNADRSRFLIRFHAASDRFREHSAGAPFTVYAIAPNAAPVIRNYAVSAGDTLEDSWLLRDFPGGKYHLRAYGPNGFFREFIGSENDPPIEFKVGYSAAGDVDVHVINRDAKRAFTIEVVEKSYAPGIHKKSVEPGASTMITLNTQRSFHWYDFSVKVDSFGDYEQRFAGRVETGEWTMTDPLINGYSVEIKRGDIRE